MTRYYYTISLTDRPASADGLLINLKIDSQYRYQILTQNNSTNLYMKTLSQGKWTDWIKL